MSSYFLWIKERGEGCKQMIGCGERLVSLMSTTIELARVEAMLKMEELSLFGGDHEARHAVIYGFVENITHIYDAKNAKLKSITAEDRKKKEIEELEQRLKKLKGPGK